MQDSGVRPNFQIFRAWAKNFRSISDTSFELDPLTVLVGANAAGKSNLIDILRFIKDALRFDLEVAISQRHGLAAIYHQNADAEQPHIHMGVAATVRSRHAERGYASIEYGFALTQTEEGVYRVSHEYANIWEGDVRSPTLGFSIEDGNLVSATLPIPGNPDTMLLLEDSSDFNTVDLALPTLVRMTRRFFSLKWEEDSNLIPLFYDALRQLHGNLNSARFYHIFPNTIREPQRLSNTHSLDEDASNLGSTLRQLERETPMRMARIKESLGRLIPGISDLEVVLVGGYLVVRLKHGSESKGNWLDLSQESDGTVRLLGLLVALNQRRPLPLIGIEEPELTVHPGSLAVLADIINEAARRSQIIITTHSPDFIDCVTDYKAVESLRIVEFVDGATKVEQVARTQIEAVTEKLFSPGELHRMGELRLSQRN